MKRTWIALLTMVLVCAVALTAASVVLGSKALPMPLTELCTIGDPSVASGLHMTGRIGLENNRLQWEMELDAAGDATDSTFRFAYSDPQRRMSWPFSGYGWAVCCTLLHAEDEEDPFRQEILRQARTSHEDEVEVTVRLADYWQNLPLELVSCNGGCTDFYDIADAWYRQESVDFPVLCLPVDESDQFTATATRRSDGSYAIYSYDLTGITSSQYYTCFSLPLEGGTLTTLGINPAAQPQADWAPEGYGLWYIPLQTSEDSGNSVPVVSRRQLVYPLDITRQQVLLLRQADGIVYLMTQEDGQLVLRLLETGSYRTLQELTLGPAEEDSASYDLAVRDGFAVVFRGEQLTVLSRTEEGYHLDYTCLTQPLYLSQTATTISFEKPAAEPYEVWSVGASDFTMAYQDGKLAIAAYRRNYGGDILLLEVYDSEGVQYATARVPDVERHLAGETGSFLWLRAYSEAPFPEANLSIPTPELNWEK